MKIQISLAGEIIPGGVYSSVKPIGVCVDKLRWLFRTIRDVKPDIDDLKLHCTVLYSRNEDKAEGFLKGKRVYIARIKEFTSWVGHDDKPYLVLLLDSAELQSAFNDWRALGYSTDFPEYRPHITVAKDLSPEDMQWAMDRLNANLKKDQPFVITFGAQEIEPLRD